MKDVIEKLTELKESIHDANVESFVEAADDWVAMLETVVEDLTAVSGLLENQAHRIVALEEQVSELEEEGGWEEDPTIAVNVDSLPDQLKLAHIEEVFSQYSLEEIEMYLPKRYF